MAPLRVMIVDDVADTRTNIRRLLEFDDDFEVVGEAGNGMEAVERAKELVPDCILMDINMPVKDGIEATQSITVEVPKSAIVMMSVQGEQEYLRKAMLAGARDYLVKPFAADELVQTLRRVCDLEAERRQRHAQMDDRSGRAPGRVISVFSTKGGVGKTTVATNLAVMLCKEHKQKVALVDLDLQFGDVPVLLDLVPSQTLADLTREEEIDQELVEQYVIRHSSGVGVVAAPARPEEAELVRPTHVDQVIEFLQTSFDYVVVDMPNGFHETVLSGLDRSDHILFVVTLDVPTVKNARLGLEVMKSLNYDAADISIVLNRADEDYGVSVRVAEENLERKISVQIPSNPDVVMSSVNEGRPFVLEHPEADVSGSVREVTRLLGIQPPQAKRGKGLFRLFQRAHA